MLAWGSVALGVASFWELGVSCVAALLPGIGGGLQ